MGERLHVKVLLCIDQCAVNVVHCAKGGKLRGTCTAMELWWPLPSDPKSVCEVIVCCSTCVTYLRMLHL
jgi:hypothetical protein